MATLVVEPQRQQRPSSHEEYAAVSRQLFFEGEGPNNYSNNQYNGNDEIMMYNHHHAQPRRSDSPPPPLSPSPLTRVKAGVTSLQQQQHPPSPPLPPAYGGNIMDDNNTCLSPQSMSRELIDTEESIRLGLMRMGKNKKKNHHRRSSSSGSSGILKRTSTSSKHEHLYYGHNMAPHHHGDDGIASFHPPQYIVVESHPRNVDFFGQVLCIEIDRIGRDHHKNVWWTLREMEKFRYDAARCKDRKAQFGIRRSSRCVNHTRRVLLQQDTNEMLDGAVDDEYLANISAESSQKSRDAAYQVALRVEEEVEQESIVSPSSQISTNDDSPMFMADYYIGSFLSLCGSF
mmetsp:Transcript_19536/g.47160  ORF Transcript_19536/g.47160 Transcript_19536/m.47160 type:complete len:344 (+) Transcript_19536:235-1266(+)